MRGGELALETQLLLQEATQITQRVVVESSLDTASALPVESEFDAATNALLTKLRKKKEVRRAQHQQLNQRRLSVQGSPSMTKSTNLQSPRQLFKLPVAAATGATARKKLDMLSKLRTKAIQQGAQNLATLFGYATVEEHVKSLDERDKDKLVADEKITKNDEDGTMECVEAAVEAIPDVAMLPHVEEEKVLHSTDEVHERVNVAPQCKKIQNEAATEDDGNEADSEQDENDEIGELHAATTAHKSNMVESMISKDKAAGYRTLLRAEALQSRHRNRRDHFVESEAEEEEEEDALQIGGLGDFGFGVPQAKTLESKEADEERNALQLRPDDLDHIVDELSDDERAEEQALEEIFRREQEDQDRQQVKAVMRNVKEGFGRNRRAFSGLLATSEARGRFNLEELVAADGSKLEAARLGLLESDEEVSDADDGTTEKSRENGEIEDEEDEEAEMERMLRERFQSQPQIYVTSSESESDNDSDAKCDGVDDDIESDDERERQQMKLFSERARINRRMQRMKDLQRQIALETNQVDSNVKRTAKMPNLLIEEDKDSQELLRMMNRTDGDVIGRKKPKTRGRFHSLGAITSAFQSSSSFSRVIGHCKLFSAESTGSSSTSSKGFVFTSFGNDTTAGASDKNAAVTNHDKKAASETPLEVGQCKSWSVKAATKRPGFASTGAGNACNKKRKSSDLFSVLSSFQCVSSKRHES